MKYFKYIITTVLLVSLAACDSLTDPDLPIPLDETMENTGAFLRVLEVESGAIDILTIEEAGYIFTAEYWDNEGQSLLDNVEIYVTFTGNDGLEVDRTLIRTVDSSAFGTNEATGWPSYRFELMATDINAAIGITNDDNLLGDVYEIDWVLNLTDGRSFGVDDMSPAVSGGFFNSANFANVEVVAAIPEDEFVGSYNFMQTTNVGTTSLAFAAFGTSTWMFNAAQDWDADIEINPANTLNGRTIDVTPFAQFRGFPDPSTVEFAVALANDPADNTVTLTSSVGTGVQCSFGIVYASAGSGSGDFDIDDDSSFTLAVRENADGDCGMDPVDIPFIVTKN